MGGVSKLLNGSLAKAWGKIMIGPAQGLVAEKVYENNKTDTTSFLMPGLATADRLKQGDSVGEALGDPGAYFTQTTSEKEAAAAEEEQDRLNATPPSITSASIQARQAADRLKRRKGVLANIYGVGTSGASAGVKTLLGS